MNLLRRLRAVLNIALFWGLVWAGAGFVLIVGRRLLGFHMPPQAEFEFWNYVSNGMLLYGGVGGGVSTLFSLLLLTIRRRDGVEHLSWKPVAALGALVGALVVAAITIVFVRGPFLRISSMLVPLATFSALGSASALATLAVARRAPIGPGKETPELPAP